MQSEWNKFFLAQNSSEPLFRQIYRIILSEIVAGKYPPGAKLPGLTTLATRFGVSIIPVNRALDELIRQGYCTRRPKQGTFVSLAIPEPERTDSGKVIILYAEQVNSEHDPVSVPFYSHICKIIEHTTQASLLIISGTDATAQLENQLELRRSECLGVIVIFSRSFESLLGRAHRNPGVSFVLLNYNYPHFAELAPPNLTGVFNDEFCGGYLACSHLIGGGHRRFGILQYEVGNENYRLRIAGFQQAHADSQTILAANSILDVGVSLPPVERGFSGIAALLEQNPRLDAVFCVNDLLAAGACKYLVMNNIRSGVEVVGYDNNIPELHKMNRFATISINTEMMAVAAVKMLLKPSGYQAKQLLIAPQLVQG